MREIRNLGINPRLVHRDYVVAEPTTDVKNFLVGGTVLGLLFIGSLAVYKTILEPNLPLITQQLGIWGQSISATVKNVTDWFMIIADSLHTLKNWQIP